MMIILKRATEFEQPNKKLKKTKSKKKNKKKEKRKAKKKEKQKKSNNKKNSDQIMTLIHQILRAGNFEVR